MSREIAVVILGESAAPLARKLVGALPGARLHGLANRVPTADVAFADVAGHVQALFEAGSSIVAIFATGALIRILAPLLAVKERESPVIAVAEDGSSVIPLLGGHRGGNALSKEIGSLLGVAPAITTASELRFSVAFDEPPAGYRLANPEHVKPFTAALLAGEGVRLDGAAPWLLDSKIMIDPAGPLSIAITDEIRQGGPRSLVYHPTTVAIGVGCERGTESEELAALVRQSLEEVKVAGGSVSGIFSLDIKADEPAVRAIADSLCVPTRYFTAAELERETPRLANPSERVFREVGCHGVAEAAALAATGAGGILILPKRRSGRSTCALARAPAPFDGSRIGRQRGRLLVVGIGPGGRQWMTPEAMSFIAAASDVVGYSLYLDLLGPLPRGTARHEFPLGQEVERVDSALDLAAEGRTVALVSSGDPGVYAMASLVFERIERGAPAWRPIEVRVAPGITAMQAAAARIGAPLGHDFCAISLSDLLTPWPIIERRLRTAAEGDFVIALYNVVSRRRTRQFDRAREILLQHRASDTPVVLARNLGRIGEAIRVVDLAALRPSDVDMLTLVLIGSSSTRRFVRGDGTVRVYTPRGYDRQSEAEVAE
ncbi:MAG TPA: precorrin-3B C(17)-methyltransferase [Alphaproteobacteria bacterium]|nr:precorrin-3B C(17)-methyltransferase [Alphaproteobacteria bacterium]